MKLRVNDGTQVVADRVYVGGEVFDVPKGFEDEARRWVGQGYAEEINKARLRRPPKK